MTLSIHDYILLDVFKHFVEHTDDCKKCKKILQGIANKKMNQECFKGYFTAVMKCKC